jgi:hypothetical protein
VGEGTAQEVTGSAALCREEDGPTRYCLGCGVMPADVTHLCPPQGTTIGRLTSCPYAEPDWYCTEPVGHAGPHRGEGQT